MVQTVIGIKSAMMRVSGNKKKQMKDYKKELQDIISQVDAAKNRLAELTVDMDAEDMDVDGLDEALDALDDAIDIMEEALSNRTW